ncbi:tyrosine-protein phosphatase [Polaribacter sp.]|uniref:tyrosine-protein phosphatase n=1 Tax=Polaribacter sp. TaxID=1920175 RepID=UPI00404740DB
MFFLKKKEIPLTEFFPIGMVDIHSHLLPGIDDGAKDIADSLALIERMASYGITRFVTTPHILGDLYPNTPAIIQEKMALVQEALTSKGWGHIHIRAAAEYMLDEQFSVLLEQGNLLTLKDNMVLVEMSYFSPPLNVYELLFQLQLKGYKPVLAHPERYFTYHKNPIEFQKLKRAGCLFQLNLLSLTENYGKPVQKTAELLLKEGMYDFVGTDTHHQQHLDALQKISTKENLKLLEGVMQSNLDFV